MKTDMTAVLVAVACFVAELGHSQLRTADTNSLQSRVSAAVRKAEIDASGKGHTQVLQSVTNAAARAVAGRSPKELTGAPVVFTNANRTATIRGHEVLTQSPNYIWRIMLTDAGGRIEPVLVQALPICKTP